jgi:hypothetical protein
MRAKSASGGSCLACDAAPDRYGSLRRGRLRCHSLCAEETDPYLLGINHAVSLSSMRFDEKSHSTDRFAVVVYVRKKSSDLTNMCMYSIN